MKFRFKFIFCLWMSSWSCTVWWESHPSSIGLLLHLCIKTVEHMYGSISWSTSSVLWDLRGVQTKPLLLLSLLRTPCSFFAWFFLLLLLSWKFFSYWSKGTNILLGKKGGIRYTVIWFLIVFQVYLLHNIVIFVLENSVLNYLGY